MRIVSDVREERARRLRAAGCLPCPTRWLGALGVISIAGVSHAQDPADAQTRCLEAHEQAQVDRLDGKLRAAAAGLRLCADVVCPAVIRDDCVRWTEAVSSELPTVIFAAQSEDGDESEVRVLANGELVAPQLDGKPVALDPGAYRLRFEHPAAAPIEVPVVLRAGEHDRVVTVTFVLRPEPEPVAAPPAAPTETPPPPPDFGAPRPATWPTYLLGSLAVVGTTSAIVFGVSARKDRDDAARSCAPVCDDDTVDAIRRRAVVADVSTVVAVGSAATAALLFVVGPTHRRDRRTAWGVAVAPDGGYVSVQGELR